MKEVRQLQEELEPSTLSPTTTTTGGNPSPDWDMEALSQQPSTPHPRAIHPDSATVDSTNHSVEPIHQQLFDQLQDCKLQVSLKDLLQLSPILNKLICDRLTSPCQPDPDEGTTLEPESITIVAAAVIDKHMPVISISVGKNIVDDVLIDGGSGVNVITDDERRRLELAKPSLAPFNLKMADGTIARPKGLIRDVRIHIHSIPYIVTLIVIDCLTIKSDYQMLLGQPWLRHAKVIHDWGNNEVQIMANGTVKIVKINRQLGYKAVTPHALVCYNFVEGITDDEEAMLMASDPGLHTLGTIDLNLLNQASPVDPITTSTIDPRSELAVNATKLEPTPGDSPCIDHSIHHSLGTMLVDETPIQQKLQFMDIAHWNHNKEDRLELINIDAPVDPKCLKLNANLSPTLRTSAESLFKEFIDIFSFSYEDLKGIPEHIATHQIELNPTISPSHQARYCMNPNYAKVVKDELERLLTAGFIAPIDQATWLSPIVVVPKKNGKLHNFVDFRRLNAATKKDPYPLPFTDEVLDTVIGYEAYSFIDCFPDITMCASTRRINRRQHSSHSGVHTSG